MCLQALKGVFEGFFPGSRLDAERADALERKHAESGPRRPSRIFGRGDGLHAAAGAFELDDPFGEFGSSAGTIVTVFNVVLIVVLTIYVLRAKTWKKLALHTNIDSKANMFDENALQVGDCGKTMTRLAPMGTAMIGNVRYEVTSLEGIIDPGTDVEVVLMEDNKIYVKPLQDDF